MSYLNLSLHSKNNRLAQILADIDVGGAPTMNFYAGPPPATPDDTPAGALLASLPCNSTFGATSLAIDTPIVTAAGSGYTSIPVFALLGATGGFGATFQVIMQLATLSIGNGGNNYAVGDLIVLPKPSAACLASVVLVATSVAAGGVLTGVSMQSAGQFVGGLPGGPVSQFESSGLGSGAAFTFLTYSVAAVQTIAPGLNYTSAGESGAALFTGGGGSGAAASPRLTPILVASPITTANAVAGGSVGLARISNGGGLALTLANPGSSGTDGTFPLSVTGGTGSGFIGSFTVLGGQVVTLQVTNSGSYTVAPTGVVVTGSAGLSGASVTPALGAGVVDLDVGMAGSGASVIINTMSVVTGGPVVVTSAFIAEA